MCLENSKAVKRRQNDVGACLFSARCVLRRGKQSGLCSADFPTIVALVNRADDKLFESLLHNPHHVLNSLMQDETVCSYELSQS